MHAQWDEVTPLSAVDWSGTGLGSVDQLIRSGMLELIPARISVFDRDFCYLFVNDEWCRFFERRREDVVLRTLADVLGESVFATTRDDVFEQAFNACTFRRRGWRRYPNGRRYIQETVMPFVAHGEVEAVLVLSNDHTNLKQREEELRQTTHELEVSRTLKSAIYDNALAGLVSATSEGVIVEFNPAAERMFGASRGDRVGTSIDLLFIGEDGMPLDIARLAKDVAPATGKRLRACGVKADGERFPIELAIWRTRIGGATYLAASIIDSTERHKAEQQLQRHRETLRQTEKLTMMGGLLAGVAHELNNPLAVAMGRAGLLEEKCQDPALKDDARRIREATDRCARIVRTFLRMARRRPEQRVTIDLNDIVQTSLEMLRYAFRSRDIRIQLDLVNGLPTLSADPDQISQIVINLLMNAQQAFDGSERLREIEIATGTTDVLAPDRGFAWIRITDSGPGISRELQASIFEPFFTTKEEGVGTGLGLSISRTLARAHGGDLRLIDSGSSRGAAFELRLPLVAPVTTATA